MKSEFHLGKQAPASVGNARHYDAVIVGAGFSGMYMTYLLNKAGYRVKGFEAGADVGGVWYWNRYPGARCDSQSFVYSYMFSKEMYRSYPLLFAEQPEILDYLKFAADKMDVRKSFQFDTRVESAHYTEVDNCWTIRLSDGNSVTATYFITAVGSLSAANIPSIKGLDRFAGEIYHTGQWPHKKVDFTGKRVGVIGTGSSGIQAIPVIAKEAAHLTVFMRTPQYSLPARNRKLDPTFLKGLDADFEGLVRAVRSNDVAMVVGTPTRRVVEDSPEERTRVFEAAWKEGGALKLVFESYTDIAVDADANRAVADFVRAKIRETVEDPAKAEMLIPNYEILAKCIVLDTDFFETFNRSNVDLIALRQTPIDEIVEGGIRTTETEIDLDVIVFATGYNALTGPLLSFDIRGRGGISLHDKWQGGAKLQSYLGVANAGFPNMFTLTGPQSPAVHGNVPTLIEQHAEWVFDCIQHMTSIGADTIEPHPEADMEWALQCNEVVQRTLFADADNWYTGANIDGKPRATLTYRGGIRAFRKRCDEVAADGYHGFRITMAADNAVRE